MTLPTPDDFLDIKVEAKDTCCCPDDYRNGRRSGAIIAYGAVAKELRRKEKEIFKKTKSGTMRAFLIIQANDELIEQLESGGTKR